MSLETPYDETNIFAKIVSGDMPSIKLYESDKVLSFMDVFPQSEGHCLVIHKTQRATNLLDIEQDALSDIIKSVQTVAKAVKEALAPDGIKIIQFNGAPAGQTVFHLHFHIIPIYENAPLAPHHDGGPLSADDLEPIAEKIRAAL